MARRLFKTPDVGEGTAEVEIVKWRVAEGDVVTEEQPLVDVMTDKATVEVSCPMSGRVVSLGGKEGERVAVGAILVEFEIEGGPDEVATAAPEPVAAVAISTPTAARAGRALAAPAVRNRAHALGLDLSTIAGSGPEGRVLHADLDAALVAHGGPAKATPKAAPVVAGGFDEIKILGLRRRIAERMAASKREAPHFTYVEDVDVTELEALRARLNAATPQARLTPLPFLIRAIIHAVRSRPEVNAHFLEKEGVIRRYAAVHIGVATATDAGLTVPVLRDAQTLDVRRIGAEVARLAEAARAGTAKPEELAGSTITITSLGALGGIVSTPILNLPEVAIVGVTKVEERAVVRGGAVVVRKMMNLSSSFDHRAVDGHTAAAFIAVMKRALEAPAILAAKFKV